MQLVRRWYSFKLKQIQAALIEQTAVNCLDCTALILTIPNDSLQWDSHAYGMLSVPVLHHLCRDMPIVHALQMACVVEPLPASARQSSLRSQNQPGFPPRVIEPPCTAWLLLEKEPSLPPSVSPPPPPPPTPPTVPRHFLPAQVLLALHI